MKTARYHSHLVFVALPLAAALAGGCVAEELGGELSSETLESDDATASATPTEPLGAPLDEASTEEVFGVAVGELVEVEDGIMLPVPESGQKIAINVVYGDGIMTTVALGHDVDGHVRITHPDDFLMGLSGRAAASCAGKCQDSSYSYLFGAPAKWKSPLQWHYRHNNSPINKSAALDAFRFSAGVLSGSRNSCGMADLVDATQTYMGETAVTPGVVVSGGAVGCDAARLTDGINVVGWGGLPGNTLAVTCVGAVDDGTGIGQIVAVDMRYDKDQSWYARNAVPQNCNNRFSLRGVATHEFGHAYGLGNTSPCNLAMAPSASPCSSQSRLLGRGDVRGMRSLY